VLKIVLGLIVALLGSAAGLSWHLDRLSKQVGVERWSPPREDVMTAIATDYDVLLADAFWIKFLQYNGEKLTEAWETRKFDNLMAGFRLITALDPRFQDAYIFGSWVLGDAGEPDNAAKLVQLARLRNPDLPWYPYQLGYIEMLYRRDKVAASRAFFDAATLFEKPPANLRMAVKSKKMAAYLTEKVDQTDIAISAWRDILRASRRLGDKRMIAIAENALRRLGVIDLPED
jgi:hypothetical protein